jgi:hypothetical protein
MLCPLCQYQFDDAAACHGCGLTKHCTMVKCPNCSYEFVDKSQLVGFLVKIFNYFRKKKGSEAKL